MEARGLAIGSRKMRPMKHAWLLVIALTACGKKDKDAAPATGTAPGTAPATGAAPATVDAAAAPTPPAAGAVALTTQTQPTLGCFAWSDKLKAAACFVGTTGLGVDFEVKLHYVGAAGATPVAVTETLDQNTVDAANKYLADNGFAAPATPKLLAAGDNTAGPVTINWTRKQSAPGGDNQPPTYKDTLVATCGAKKLTLLDTETEGGDLTAFATVQGDRVLVVQHMHVGREGESSDTLDATVIDPAACAATGA